MNDYTINPQGNHLSTDNRRLEQFLFVHELLFIHQYRNLDGRTIWVYDVSPDLMQTVDEYYQVQRKRYERTVYNNEIR